MAVANANNVALFGGTFDPVHRGHIAVARAALALPEAALTKVVFVPADLPPHKLYRDITPYAHRLAMLRLAAEDEARLEVSDIEQRNSTDDPPNFTIETVRRYRQQHADAKIFLLMGVDTFSELSRWREPAALRRECEFIVASRPGAATAASGSAFADAGKGDNEARVHWLNSLAEDVSSSGLRKAIAADAAGNGAWRQAVGAKVADYILEHKLYGASAVKA